MALRAFVEKDMYAKDEFNNYILKNKSTRKKKAEPPYYPHIYDGNVSANMNGKN